MRYKKLFFIIIMIFISATAYALYDYSNAAIDGKDYGEFLGEKDGKTAALNNKTKNYLASMPNNNATAIDGFVKWRIAQDTEKDAFYKNLPTTYGAIFYDNFKPSYESSYNIAYDNNTNIVKPPSSQTELAKANGKKAGEIDGRIAGQADASARVKSNWVIALYGNPKETGYPLYPKLIEELYNLNNETPAYKTLFLNEYLSSYRAAYEQAFSNANFENVTGGDGSVQVQEDPEKTKGEASGKVFGQNDGYRNGVSDYLIGKIKNSNASIKSEAEIIKAFSLAEQSGNYRSAFLNAYKIGYKQAYDEAYRNANMDPRQTAYDEGFAEGSTFGNTDGNAAAKNDYYNGKPNNWIQALSTDEQLETQYEMLKEIKEYNNGFLNGYKINFESAYTKMYRESKNNYITQMSKNAEINAKEIGEKAGEKAGGIDLLSNKPNNWYAAIENDNDLIQKYRLDKESIKYKNDFISFYKKHFMESYIKQFQDLKTDIAKNNEEIYEINGAGGVIRYDSKDGFDESLEIEIPSNSILRKTSFLISQQEYLQYHFTGKYIPLTNVYELSVKNDVNHVKLYEPLKLSIKYYGSQNASIYENINGEWLYLPTKNYRENDSYVATAEIRQSNLKKAKYSVFIDEGYKPTIDTEGHWAQSEIDMFLRRHYISGYPDGTFLANKKVTRAEFLIMLDKAIKLSDAKSGNVSFFKDSVTFGSFENSISKAYGQGLITGYPDTTFRPNMPITYQEVEWVISKLPIYKNFKWNSIAEKMSTEKNVYSNSLKSKKEYINRAEVVYMLYSLLNIEGE